MADEASALPVHDPRSAAAAADRAAGTCPYLLAANGHWRATTPSRDHRCTAFAPAAPLAADKQRRLCLVPEHTSCATYVAAVSARRERGLPADGGQVSRWAPVRTTPVVDVGVGVGAMAAGLVADRRGWQVIPAVVLVIALAALGLSGLGRGLPATAAIPTASPTPIVTARPTPEPTAPPASVPASEAPTITPAPTEPPASPAPTPSPVPSASRTYTVRTGDTLYGIAVAFHTSVSAIKSLNNLSSNTIHAGLVLRIP